MERQAGNLTDESGNMTLAGGLTAAGTVNANGGINIPLAVGAATDTSAVNRLYASGLAAVTAAFSPQSFLSDFSLVRRERRRRSDGSGLVVEAQKDVRKSGNSPG